MSYREEWTRLTNTIQGLENNTDFTLDAMEKSVAPGNGAFAFLQGGKDGYSVAGVFARNVVVPDREAAVNLQHALTTLKDCDLEADTTPDPWHVGRAKAFMDVIALVAEMVEAQDGSDQ